MPIAANRPAVNPSTELLDYQAALAFLYGRIDYERARAMPYCSRRFKLDRMREFLARLGSPHDNMPAVHIAGTKGKGSTAVMIAAILSAAGYRTGLYTSPHLDRLEERLVVDGCMCSEQELVKLVARVRPEVEALDRRAAVVPGETGPTYFEITTAMALLHFARRRVDLAVLEVGLGGRLDSTNVCRPLVTAITSISYDHTRQLGKTLALIAEEKAGIIKPRVPVVSGVTEREPGEVIERIARRRGCELFALGEDFDFRYEPPRALDAVAPGPWDSPACSGKLDFRQRDGRDEYRLADLSLGLLGSHQAGNAAVAVATVRLLDQSGRLERPIPEEAIRRGLAEARCPARIEIVSRRPTVVIDAAHNVAAIEALVRALRESFSAPRRLLIFAATKEKDAAGMLRLVLPFFDQIIFTRYLNNPRSVDPHELAALAGRIGAESDGVLTGRCTVCADPAAALDLALRSVEPDRLICATGSFFIAAEIRAVALTILGFAGKPM